MGFNVGNLVFVPNAFEWKWESCLTWIERIEKVDGAYCGNIYYANCPHNNLFSNNDGIRMVERSFKESEVFATNEECKKYVNDHYYEGLCVGCKYIKVNGNIWKCTDCEFAEKIIPKDRTENYSLKCKKSKITVGIQYSCGSEICKFYKPTLPQNIRDYISWENYNDILMNCEFNQKCVHHTQSAHRTCNYEWYMNQLVKIPINFGFNSRTVKYARIKRKQWIEQTFLNGNVLECYSLEYERERTKTGRIKKNSIYFVAFDGITKVDIEKGEIVE